MDFSQAIPVKQLADRFSAHLHGNADLFATGINEIHKVRPGDICFVDHPKYYDKCLKSAATIIFIDKEVTVPEGKAVLVMESPFEAYNELVLEHRPHYTQLSQIDPRAKVDPTATIEAGVIIGPHCEIGAHTVIQSGVVLQEHCYIGKHCLIQSGAILGSDAFYFKKSEEGYTKWRSGGRVIIQDHVDIGANCTINKGVSGDTLIGRGSKLDCLVHVAHGTVIGERCLIAAQVGIAGKCQIGDDVTLYGQVGVAHGSHIASGTVILAQSGVAKSLSKDTYFGSPARPVRESLKDLAAVKRIPWMYEKLKSLLRSAD